MGSHMAIVECAEKCDAPGVGWVLRGRMVVYINLVTMGEERWDSYLVDMKAKLGNGDGHESG